MNEKRMRVWILGLIHSGTTVFWRAFRQDARFFCIDEPLSTDIGMCFPENNEKRTYDEYLRLFASVPERFWELYEPIEPLQELDTSFTVEQERYLNFLLERPEPMVIDETHAHLHLPALAEMTPDAHIVHLYRRASSFATSHLRPSWSRRTTRLHRITRRLRNEYNKRIFWTREEFLPDMRRREAIGHHPASKFGLMLTEAGYDTHRIMAAPALVRLLAYWHYHYHYLEREGRRLYGERFHSLPYETFATDPNGTMRQLYDWINLSPPERIDYGQVHPPKPAYRAGAQRWHQAAGVAGFTDEEIRTLL